MYFVPSCYDTQKNERRDQSNSTTKISIYTKRTREKQVFDIIDR